MRGVFPSSALTLMKITPPSTLELFQFQLGCLTLGTLLMVVQPAHTLAGPRPEPPRAAVFSDSLPGFDQALAREISGQVQAAGYTTEFIGATALTNQTALTAKRYNLLVLPGARSLPMAAAPAIQGYLQQGGDSVGAGAAGLAVAAVSGQRPMDVAADITRRRSPPSGHNTRSEDFDHADLKRWTRSAAGPEAQAEYELAARRSRQGAAREGRPLVWLGYVPLAAF